MREKYESLAVSVLRDLAKARGIKNFSTMKKAELVEAMLAKDEQEKTENGAAEKPAQEKTAEKTAEKAAEKPVQEKNTSEKRNSENTSEEKNADQTKDNQTPDETLSSLDSGVTANGILEVMPDGYGFIRCENYLPG